jgi:hypothetical protein
LPTEPVFFEVKLTGAAEVPAVTSAASGLAKLIFYPETSVLDIDISVTGIGPSDITGAHLHRGGTKENGPHVFDIINSGFAAVGAATVLSDSAVRDLLTGNLYLNVHSRQFPGGELRGQLDLAAADHDDHEHEDDHTHGSGTIHPPSTGDGGLLVTRQSGSAKSLTAVTLVIALGLTIRSFCLVKKAG